jgi:predicted nucleic acid-binding protein
VSEGDEPPVLEERGPPAERGLDYVCFDATQLIAFNEVGALDVLGRWFPKAFTPNVVTEDEIRAHLGKFPQGQRILDAEWLEAVAVDSDEGLELVRFLHDDLWKSGAGKDRGEAEVLALCRDYGWLAILDDDQARKAATRENIKVPSAMLLTVIIAAAAHGLIAPGEAWKLHAAIDKKRSEKKGLGSFSFLTGQDVHRVAFMNSIHEFRRIHKKQGEPAWPRLLATPGLDGVIVAVRQRS